MRHRSDQKTARHPIRVVARRTGLSTPLLRAWERRYGAVAPTRTQGGQRLYSDENIRRLQLLSSVVEAGRRIGQVVEMTTAELEELALEDLGARVGPGPVGPSGERALRRALSAVDTMDGPKLEAELMAAALALRPEEVVDELLVPLLVEIGAGWSVGRFGPASEHLASAVIGPFLRWMVSTIQIDEDAPLIVTGTPAGQRHELGALLAAVSAVGEGWRARFLGPDLPAEELARAVRTLGGSVLGLSVVYPTLGPDAFEELLYLRSLLPERVKLVVGGRGVGERGIGLSEARVLWFADLRAFRNGLNGRLRPSGPSPGW